MSLAEGYNRGARVLRARCCMYFVNRGRQDVEMDFSQTIIIVGYNYASIPIRFLLSDLGGNSSTLSLRGINMKDRRLVGVRQKNHMQMRSIANDTGR